MIKNHGKYFALIAGWLITMMIIVGGSIFYKKFQGAEYDERAIPYLKGVIPEISQWNPVKTKALMVPEIAATIPDEKFARAMTFFSQLGALQSMDEPGFEKAFIDEETDLGKQTIIEYNVVTHYENGEAEINFKLLERDGRFQIYRFNFSSEVLLPE